MENARRTAEGGEQKAGHRGQGTQDGFPPSVRRSPISVKEAGGRKTVDGKSVSSSRRTPVSDPRKRTEKSLFKRVEGYFYEEKTEELRKVEELDPLTGESVTVEKLVVIKVVHKHVPPDTRSIIFAAKCLMPDKYKDNSEAQMPGFTEFMSELQEARKRASRRQPSFPGESSSETTS